MDIPVHSSSNSSLWSTPKSCFYYTTTRLHLTALLISYVLVLLPLFLHVLYLGFQRRGRQRSPSQAARICHLDVFTFHMASLELCGIFGFGLYCCGTYTNLPDMLKVGLLMVETVSPGRTLFHILTCVDRYLAVVHAVTYLGLKQSAGVRIRNVLIACVWLLSVASLGQTITLKIYNISNILFLSCSFAVVLFCCLSVLFAVIRPGPGDTGGIRKGDPSKQRAFYTILAIMAALVTRFWAVLVFNAVIASPEASVIDYCLVMLVSSWFPLPSSLVLPLLFLHRVRKLSGTKQTPGSLKFLRCRKSKK